MKLEQWFQKGMTVEEYINSMKTHRENLQTILDTFETPETDQDFFATLKKEHLRVIVITEDWCGDAMLNIPILLNLAEKADMEVRMILRDQNLELMDQYLTNGTARAIPIFIFIDPDGNERAVWGPRAESVQAYVDEQRAQLPPKTDANFEEKQKMMYEAMMEKYVTDPAVWNEVYESIKARLS